MEKFELYFYAKMSRSLQKKVGWDESYEGTAVSSKHLENLPEHLQKVDI